MTEHPIIFSTDMVQAILDGRKTMTRRTRGLEAINKNPNDWKFLGFDTNYPALACFLNTDGTEEQIKCPYGQAGDRLWVRETIEANSEDIFYVADGMSLSINSLNEDQLNWIAGYGITDQEHNIIRSIHMPRWASRINLDNINIRVERLQEISLQDKWNEGYPPEIGDFKVLWDSLHAKPKPVKHNGLITHYVSYPWEDITEIRKYRGKPWYVYGNPYLWVIEFKKL